MAYKAKSITSKASSACRMNMALANSPAKIAPAIMAAAPAIIGALSKGKKEKSSGGKTTVIVKNNNKSSSNSTSNSQAGNAIEPK